MGGGWVPPASPWERLDGNLGWRSGKGGKFKRLVSRQHHYRLSPLHAPLIVKPWHEPWKFRPGSGSEGVQTMWRHTVIFVGQPEAQENWWWPLRTRPDSGASFKENGSLWIGVVPPPHWQVRGEASMVLKTLRSAHQSADVAEILPLAMAFFNKFGIWLIQHGCIF